MPTSAVGTLCGQYAALEPPKPQRQFPSAGPFTPHRFCIATRVCFAADCQYFHVVARRATHPALLAVRAAHRVRSFERIALTQSAPRTSSIATASLRFLLR